MSENNIGEILENFQPFTTIGWNDCLLITFHLSELKYYQNHRSTVNNLTNLIDHHLGVSGSGAAEEINDQNGSLHFGQEVAHQNMDGGSNANSPDLGEISFSIEDYYENFNTSISVTYFDKVMEIEVPKCITVGCIKTLIYSETGIDPRLQELRGWRQEPESDLTPLYELNLIGKTFLTLEKRESLSDIGAEEDDSPMEVVDNAQTTYILKIHDEVNGKEYNMLLPGETDINQVKADTFALSNIPVGDQLWGGWPENVRDESKLNELNLDRPIHSLTVQANIAEENLNGSDISPLMSIELSDLLDPDDIALELQNDLEGLANEEMFYNPDQWASRPALIPDNVQQEIEGSYHFIRGYNERYGPLSPSFYPGTLLDAIKEAGVRPVVERKILAIYLHHDGSNLTDDFCTELLGHEILHQIFSRFFVLWGWDITNQSNKDMFLSSVSRTMGNTLTQTLQSITVDLLPALLFVSRSYSSTELLGALYGTTSMNELHSMLSQVVDLFSYIQQIESKKEEERAARERIKAEQDLAYQESLRLDRAKDEAKKQQMLLQSQEEERLKNELKIKEEQRKARILAAESQLPEEPENDDDVITFRFRSPRSEIFERKFLALTKLEVLFNYLVVKGYEVEDHKIVSPWPRRELCSLDGETLLKDIFHSAHEMIILEER